jgi:hypothetical protein
MSWAAIPNASITKTEVTVKKRRLRNRQFHPFYSRETTNWALSFLAAKV